MATATYTTKSITNDFQKTKEKENRRTEGLLNRHRLVSNSGSSGSLPKRYQSVFTEGTPLTSFGVRNDDNQRRSHSPTNHIQTQSHQRPLKPVKEFLTVQPIVDQQLEDRRRSSPQSNGHIRSQTDATLQSVNAALTKTLNKLRQDPSNNGTTNGHSTAVRAGTASFRPMTSRSAAHHTVNLITTSNYYYSMPGGTKGALPTELTTRRTSNGVPPGRLSNGNGPFVVQHHEIKPNDTPSTRAPTPYRVQPKTFDVGIHQPEKLDFNAVTTDDHPDRNRKLKYDSHQQMTPRTISSRQSFSPRVPSADNQQRTLPEVSVNPHIQSSVQKNGEQVLQIREPISNGLSNDQIHLPTHDNHSKRRHHIQVEPTNTFKRTASPMKHQQIADVHPNLIVQHQRAVLTPNSNTNVAPSNPKDPLNEAYVDRDIPTAQLLIPVNTHTNNDNDSISTLKYYENQHENGKHLITPPPSPATQELNHIWKKHRNRYSSTRLGTASLAARRTSRHHRPPGRLKHYDDESGTETTETQSKDEDMARRQCLPPSDLGSDAWSDLTSEFSDTKLRKHPNIRTSTPNMTRQSSRQSSSQSSKEVGQIRKQLTDLQIMYSDLLKLLDIDIESMRSSHKSSTSSQADHNSRRHRFRKIMPVNSIRQSNIDLREVNQRFQRLETSIVTLAESIAKLSAQLQMQRVIKDDVYQLRQEVAELRQLLHHQQQPIRQQQSTPTSGFPPTTTSQQPPPRLLSPNIQRLATINSTNPLNVSTSYQPSSSMGQRSNSIIDPRQARKIEQFFGTEAMLRYFLSLLNYEEYAPVLEREKIGIYELPYISERKLQSFGIPYGPCARIIHEAQQYFISLLTLKSSGIDV